MRIDLTFYQLNLGLGTALPQFLGFFPLPLVFPEKEMYGIQEMQEKIDQAAINNVELIGVQVLFQTVIMYNMAKKENRNDGRQQGHPVSGNKEKSQKADLGLRGEEFSLKPGFDQPVSFPGKKSNGEYGQRCIIPFDVYLKIMIDIADHCIEKGIQGQQDDEQVSVSVTEHFYQLKLPCSG